MRPLPIHALLWLLFPRWGLGGTVLSFSFLFSILGPWGVYLVARPTRHCLGAQRPCHPSSCDKNFLETVRLNGLGEGAGNHSKNEKQID